LINDLHITFTLKSIVVFAEDFSYSYTKRFNELTGCPLVVNISLNVHGEPIVYTIEDVFRCFMSAELDVLVVSDYLLFKEEQDLSLKENYKDLYDLD